MKLDYELIDHKLYLNYDIAQEFAAGLGLAGKREWNHYIKGQMSSLPSPPNHFPENPEQIYRDHGWKDWKSWLGAGTKKKSGKFCSYAKARRFAHSLKLKSSRAWFNYVRSNEIPVDIPRSPQNAYTGKGWENWQHFLGSNFTFHGNRQFLPFEEAREFARTLFAFSQEEWQALAREGDLPPDIPCAPSHVYKDKGWISWGDWLGTGNTPKRGRTYLSFEEAREFCRELDLKNVIEWRAFAKTDNRPKDIPASPQTVYKNKGWLGYTDWLDL